MAPAVRFAGCNVIVITSVVMTMTLQGGEPTWAGSLDRLVQGFSPNFRCISSMENRTTTGAPEGDT